MSAKSEGVPISGPSFLGLTDSPASADGQLQYLFEDPPRHSRAKWIVTILILAALGGFLAYHRKQFPAWYSALTKPVAIRPVGTSPAATAQLPPPASSPAPAVSPAPAISNPANPANPSVPADSAGSGGSSVTEPPDNLPIAGPARETPSASATPPSPVPQSDDNSAPAESTTPAKSDRASSTQESRPDQSDKLFAKGEAYLNGQGAPRNCRQALIYLNSAADQGSAKAASQLGGLYATGHCVPLDRVKAYQYFTRAQNQEGAPNVYLEQTRAMVWNEMSPAEQARATR